MGQGTPAQTQAFREEHDLRAVLLCDPGRLSFRKLGFRREWWRLFHPRVLWRAIVALLQGHRQGALQGDPFQNGGVVLTDAQGTVLFRYDSLYPGDHPGPRELAQLERLFRSF